MHTFSIEKDAFYLDGAPFRVLAGTIHYFRVPREYWRDRLLKLKHCGFNAVETYVAWNAHMPTEDSFVTDGMLDLSAYLSLAEELGLWAIVRPGPYICAEWEAGGLPWWLLKENMPLRCADPRYLAKVDAFYDRLMPVLKPHQITEGGNVLMMQVENEYGSYGDDKEYLAHLRDGMRARGITVPLFTSDGSSDFMLTGGTLVDVHKTCNFGSRAEEQMACLRRFQPDGPLMCSEYWNGWFDHWGETHHARVPEESAEEFDKLLALGSSATAYTFHGGTNFGFMNGANCPSVHEYQPTINSYDDDALLNECGDITPKYRLFREVIAKYAPVPNEPEPASLPKANYGTVKLTQRARLFDSLPALGETHHTAAPATMETLGQGYGFILYRTHVKGQREEGVLTLQNVRDRAHVFVNGEFKGVIYRNDAESAVRFSVPAEGLTLDVLVENMGRVNYGPYLRDPKGVTEGIRLGQQFLYGWDEWTLPMDDLSKLAFENGVTPFDGTPVFLRGTFDVGDEPKDTFVKLPGFKKGVIFVNGRPLSRHWEIGPQRSAYLPAPFLKKGENELIVLELDGFDKPEAVLSDEMDLG